MAIFGTKPQPAPKANRLTAAERSSLAELEAIVTRHVATWPEVGQALATIRDKQLYRETHDTFEAYVQERWQLERIHAHRLMAAAKTLPLLPTGNKPPLESQIRPLLTLPANERADAWNEALATAPSDENGQPKLTAAHVAAAVDRRRPGKKTKRPKPLRIKVPGATVIIDANRHGVNPLDALDQARAKLAERQAAA